MASGHTLEIDYFSADMSETKKNTL